MACVLGPSVRPTAPPVVKTGHTRPACAQSNTFSLGTVSDEIAHPIPVVVLVGLIGLPPGTERHAQGRSRLAPFTWLSHSYLDEEFVVSVGCQP